jgi:radical SAM protein with 4Fe4S-binding SPASM domain
VTQETFPGHLKRISRRNIEQILEDTVGKKYGDRFVHYRSEYNRIVGGEGKGDVPPFPLTLSVETVNRCNLACIMCHLPHFEKEKTTMTTEQLVKIFADAEKLGVPAITIGNGHEPLLYNDVDTLIDEAVNHKIMDLLLFTNGHLLTKSRVEKILNSGVTRVFVSLDAATEETYNKIRKGRAARERGGRLAQVEANIRHLVQRREELGLELPIVRVSFVMQPDNAHEIAQFRDKWKDVVDAVDFQRMTSHSSIETMELLSEEERWKEREPAAHFLRLKPDERYCHYPFDTLTVWSDGTVGPCCAYQGKNIAVGNVFEQTLEEIWNGEKMNRLRKQHLEGKMNIVCQDCMACSDYSIMRTSEALK